MSTDNCWDYRNGDNRGSMSGARHIPYLSFHKSIIREVCRPQKDDLLIIAKGLGLRRVSHSFGVEGKDSGLWREG